MRIEDDTMAILKVGDKVAYAKSFLRSIHASPVDEMWKFRGTVVKVSDLGVGCVIAYVQGFPNDNEDNCAHVNIKNIAVVGSLRHAENVTADGKPGYESWRKA